MVKRFWPVLILILVTILGASAAPTAAQTYAFSVPQMEMQVYVQPDASIRIVYDITFENHGAPIDIVDIGLPHRDYDIGNMVASINDVPLTTIRRSDYIDIGVEIHLRDQAIASGERGTLHFEATMPDMVYQDTTDQAYASLRITPTWFDGDLVRGESYLGVAIHLPEGVEPDEALYQQEPFTAKALFQDRTVVLWEWSNARLTGPHMVGVSFPQRVMTRVVRMTLIDIINQWLSDNPETAFILGAVSLALFTWLFFRFSGGTGCTVFVLLAGGLLALFVLSPILILPAIPILIGLVAYNEARLKRKPKKNKYLPPIAHTEGGGIKRGLTAPEAAVLLELPLHKILTLIVFGLLEKRIVELDNQDPLTVRVREPFRTWDNAENRRSIQKRREIRRRAAQAEGTGIHDYEDFFLDQLERHPDRPVEKIDFTDPMERLIKEAAAKMKGFDIAETKEYYERVIARAMQQANEMGEVREREQYLDKHLPWVMMNEQYPTVLTGRGFHYWPMWARTARTGGGAGTSTGAGSLPAPSGRTGGGSRGGQTSFGDVAASFSGWAETTMGGMAAAIMPSSMNIPRSRGGFVDLSGVDRVTGDVFEALAKSSSSGGSRSGGGCACACAGCACACACAGGGR